MCQLFPIQCQSQGLCMQDKCSLSFILMVWDLENMHSIKMRVEDVNQRLQASICHKAPSFQYSHYCPWSGRISLDVTGGDICFAAQLLAGISWMIGNIQVHSDALFISRWVMSNLSQTVGSDSFSTVGGEAGKVVHEMLPAFRWLL